MACRKFPLYKDNFAAAVDFMGEKIAVGILWVTIVSRYPFVSSDGDNFHLIEWSLTIVSLRDFFTKLIYWMTCLLTLLEVAKGDMNPICI